MQSSSLVIKHTGTLKPARLFVCVNGMSWLLEGVKSNCRRREQPARQNLRSACLGRNSIQGVLLFWPIVAEMK
jgi:hypothetical protein